MELVDRWVRSGRPMTFLEYADRLGHMRGRAGHFMFVHYTEEEGFTHDEDEEVMENQVDGDDEDRVDGEE
jgi:hypothetical protein